MADYLVSDKLVLEEHTSFKVHKLGYRGWTAVVVLSLVFVLVNQSVLNGLIPGFGTLFTILSPIIIIISYLLWRRVGKRMIRSYVLENAREWAAHQKEDTTYTHDRGVIKNAIFKLVSKLAGIEFKKDRNYFIEAHINDIQLQRGLISTKVFNLISSCLGITFLIVIPFQLTGSQSTAGVALGLMIFLIPFSTILISWLIPVLWTLQDSNIKSLDARKIIRDYSDEIKDSFLSRFLGITGFLVAITESFRIVVNQFPAENIVGQLFIASLIVFLFALSVFATTVFLTALYFSRQHEDMVNEFRKEVINYVDVGITIVRLAEEEETATLLNPVTEKRTSQISSVEKTT